MGITISKDASLAPISAASSVIGFASFAFTLATFLRIVWGNLRTMMSANKEVRVRSPDHFRIRVA